MVCQKVVVAERNVLLTFVYPLAEYLTVSLPGNVRSLVVLEGDLNEGIFEASATSSSSFHNRRAGFKTANLRRAL